MQDTLSEKTYRELRRRVLAGEIEAGSQLVNRTLAQTLEVSLAPVREAIQRLATEGLIEYVPGAGAFVRKANSTDLEELYILREAVESAAAAEAARNISQTQLEELDEVVQEFNAILSKLRLRGEQASTVELMDHWLDCEERFHRIIVEAARNRLLAKVIEDHTALGRAFGVQRHRATILTVEVAEKTCRDHSAIAAAIRERDADTAHKLMSGHIRIGRKTILDYMRSQKRNAS